MGVLALPLTVLPRVESLALLGKHRADLAEHPALDALAAEVGDLPLALHLAGSYLETYRDDPTFGDPAKFLAELRGPHLLAHEVMQGLEAHHSPTGHERSVAKTFAISLNRLDLADATDEAARALLARAAHFAPGEPIPRRVLLASLAPDAEDRPAQKQAAHALQRLRGLGLIEASDGTAPRLHRLLAAYAHHACPDPAAPGEVEAAVLAELDAHEDSAGYIAPLDALLPHLRHSTETALPRADERAAVLANQLACYLNQSADSVLSAFRDRLLAAEQGVALREQFLEINGRERCRRFQCPEPPQMRFANSILQPPGERVGYGALGLCNRPDFALRGYVNRPSAATAPAWPPRRTPAPRSAMPH